jgi:hypothetical protein
MICRLFLCHCNKWPIRVGGVFLYTIREVFGSSLGWDTGYPYWGYSWFPSQSLQANTVISWICNHWLWLPWWCFCCVCIINKAIMGPSTQQFFSSSDVIATTCFGHTATVCYLMMVLWPKHVVAITSEDEKKNCCADGPIIALLNTVILHQSGHGLFLLLDAVKLSCWKDY